MSKASKKSKKSARRGSRQIVRARATRRSHAIVSAGITNMSELAAFCSAMMFDLSAGRVEHREAAVQSAFASKLLGIAHLQARLGMFAGKQKNRLAL